MQHFLARLNHYSREEDSDEINIHSSLISISFEDLHKRTCVGEDHPDTSDSDYETWSPYDGRQKGQCLMGRKITYSRRKRDRECFNGIQFERPTLVENCECTEDDYECDYGFVRQDEMANSPCVPISQVNYSAPSVCPAGSTYTISSGYRKVSGDTCVGGVVHAPYIIPCPSTSFMSSAGVLTYIVIIAFVIALGVGAFYYKDQIRSIFQKLKGGVKYKKLGTGEAENDEELVFNPKDSQTHYI